jgi:hypothetical protein
MRRLMLSIGTVALLASFGAGVLYSRVSSLSTSAAQTAPRSQAMSASSHQAHQHFKGRVAWINRHGGTFGLRSGNQTRRIHVTRNTQWDGCYWHRLWRGERLKVEALRQSDRWIATHVEAWGMMDHGGMMGNRGMMGGRDGDW